jgi:hypothetical protein
MGYSTIFYGKLNIQLNEPHLTTLKTHLSQVFDNKEVIVVNESSLTVDDEWKDNGLMEESALFIEKHGELISGTIRCEGEDSKDVWEIFVSDSQLFIREIGNSITLNRSTRKEKSVPNEQEAKIYRIS